ncbi:hypothetical protein [Antrihabitans stalactiti]|uniref:Uncharacterized protein n=1 Tax=Antrihabitans stalactiti TaxID=2584121 RepID=A0A848KI53_9NOCA|nr:hypothetical protein [Antrihabitans stalactiti]NMN96372.1 hypothetical protein [Antrihabitans stalactiti]
MNIRRLVAGAAILFGALTAGIGVASAVPSVGYVPTDNPATPVNEAGTVQTTFSHDEANAASWALSPLNPISPIGQQMREANQNNDCVTVNSSSLTNHVVTPYKNGEDGNCTAPVG